MRVHPYKKKLVVTNCRLETRFLVEQEIHRAHKRLESAPHPAAAATPPAPAGEAKTAVAPPADSKI